jgi:hypothetical protein
MNPTKRFTSIKQIPKEAIEMIDETEWFWMSGTKSELIVKLPERLSSEDVLEICNVATSAGAFGRYLFREPHALEDKTYGINLYKKIHGIKLDPVPLISEEKQDREA